MTSQLDILLSTYNGEPYLADQIDSLLMQSFTHWRLLIRDDDSKDNTRDIIAKYVEDYPEKVFWMKDEQGNVGAAQSFALLLGQSSAQYVALCDQDDSWYVDKLAIQMSKMLEEEERQGADFPLLINTDLKVADHSLNILSPSFWDYQNINPEKMATLKNLLVQNHITGCTCLMNRALVDLSLPINKDAVMHDWWIALIASAKGKIISISTPLVLYRQHGDNEIGATKWSVLHSVKTVCSASKISRYSLSKTRLQAMAILASGLMENDSKRIVKRYVDMFEENWFERRKTMFREKFYKSGMLRNLAMLFYL